ncbi:hypothetical protein OEV82_15780 [Caldibacillus thermolactis]|jgi:uncharacterized membrane protein HdeD (DUF308 family)|uniref:Holin n=1 Tax=Pallidibacillus thermolactis TaxID=251051 RepID=A0ABT2WJV1_9BACI|nr:hypothetical protein [Pallidibacillus thermolactis]MCU9595865.1 hypothetical protein [Pallidibacillus thermolactis]MED1674902.1 hypothetical protein [Pallidibacillus thermolactis subsp. kokeshiiformis]
MDLNIYDIALVPLISGLVEVFKQIGVPNRYCSLISIIIGLIFGILFIEEGTLKSSILIGLMLGLSASGLYSGTKCVHETIKHVKEDK